ncbi:MAG TPA: YbaB/EbfC family nucleoid-associated protein [Pseudonocardia sp.]|jgi:DNA-binding protein YbaB|uniref:YbaB/EbfC family nucleoid-associated protein n=1 Tax=Pseudonocardia sp. TaxID=60912 RepID=UPI002F414093
MDGTEWLRDYQQRVAHIGQRAKQAQDALAGLTATASSASGVVTVTVNAAGALTRISFTEQSEELSRPRLAEAVLEASRKAHAEVARRSADALRPVVGGTATERYLTGQLPREPAAGSAEWEQQVRR